MRNNKSMNGDGGDGNGKEEVSSGHRVEAVKVYPQFEMEMRGSR